MKNSRKLGFTLAEILITLSIIGVVAALTIPTLIQRTGNEEAVSRLLKVYSTLSQATEAIVTENGGVKTWAYDVDSLYDAYKKHLRNAKECSSNTGCFSQLDAKGYKRLNGAYIGENWDEWDTSRKLILSDGVQLVFSFNSADCDFSQHGSENVCAHIRADINGEKSPNAYGRDVFPFVLKADGLYPRGCDNEELARCENSTQDGWGCTCRVIREGAMNY